MRIRVRVSSRTRVRAGSVLKRCGGVRSGAVQRGMRREANPGNTNGDGRGRGGMQGERAGRQGAAGPRQAGGVAVCGTEGAEGREASAGEWGARRLTALGRWHGRRWGRQYAGAAACGRGCLWAGKQQVGKAMGPGSTFKVLSQTWTQGGKGDVGRRLEPASTGKGLM